MLKPLTITWTFRTPVVSRQDYPVMLDGLLAFAAVQRDHRENGMDEKNPWGAQDRLPLGQESGVWQASQVVFTPAGDRQVFIMTRRFEMNNFAENLEMTKGFSEEPTGHEAHLQARIKAHGFVSKSGKNKIPSEMGPFRAFLMENGCRWMEKAQAWCIGDKEEVETLLNEITHLGPLSRNGWGSVRDVTVAEATEEEADNWRLRPLPPEAGLEHPRFAYALAHQGLKPPYWKRTEYRKALVPTLAEMMPA